MHAPSEDRVRDDGERLIDDHIGKEEGDEEQMAIFAYRFDLIGVEPLFAARAFNYTAFDETRNYSRSTADTKDIQLGLIQTHIP